jgi:hypothetical protein
MGKRRLYIEGESLGGKRVCLYNSETLHPAGMSASDCAWMQAEVERLAARDGFVNLEVIEVDAEPTAEDVASAFVNAVNI